MKRVDAGRRRRRVSERRGRPVGVWEVGGDRAIYSLQIDARPSDLPSAREAVRPADRQKIFGAGKTREFTGSATRFRARFRTSGFQKKYQRINFICFFFFFVNTQFSNVHKIRRNHKKLDIVWLKIDTIFLIKIHIQTLENIYNTRFSFERSETAARFIYKLVRSGLYLFFCKRPVEMLTKFVRTCYQKSDIV